MKSFWKICLMSTILIAALVMPLTLASADTVSSNGKYVDCYDTLDATEPSGMYKVSQREVDPPVNGRYAILTAGGVKYFKKSDLVVMGDIPDPTEEPTPRPGVPTPTPVPGAPTPSPSPETVNPTRDPSYQGTILKYTVPAGGLSLYDDPAGTVVQVASAGTSLTLNQDNPPTVPGWYYTYYKGNTYYVPENLLNKEDTGTASDYSAVKSLLVANNTPLYSGYSASAGLTGPTANSIPAGTRVNVAYVGTRKIVAVPPTYEYYYSYMIGSTRYYLRYENSMSRSTATVGSSSDTDMMTKITAAAGIKLYITKSTSTSNFFVMIGGEVMYGSNLGDGWYKVSYNGGTYYVTSADITLSVTQMVANSGDLGDGRQYITAGADNSRVYRSRQIHKTSTPTGVYGKPIGFKGDPCHDDTPGGAYVLKDIPAGQTVLVGTYDSSWYTYTEGNTNYYIYRNSVADSVSGSSMSSKQVWIEMGDPLYKKLSSSSDTFEETVIRVSEDGYYVVREENLEYYLFVYNGQTLYVKKADVGTAAPIGNTATGKTYTVTIGAAGAQLYGDSACTNPSGPWLQAGTSVSATKYSETVYTVSSSGAKYYLKATTIVSIKGGDDPTVNQPGDNTNIGDVGKGEVDPTFTETVFSYKTPAGGLWLYSTVGDTNSKSLNLNANTTVNFNSISAWPDWYSTWYNGKQYFVPKSSLVVDELNTAQTGTYAITLTHEVTLYTSGAATVTGGVEKLPDNFKTSIKLAAGTRVNVRIASKYTTGADKGKVRVYQYTHFDNKTYYFLAKTGGADNVDTSSILSATIAANTDASLITQFGPFTAPTLVYSAPNLNSQILQIASGYTVYGKSYNVDWYQVVYQNVVWYLPKATYTDAKEQIAVSSAAGSTTYTVTVGPNGARLYTKPQTNTGIVKVSGVTWPAYTQNWLGYVVGPPEVLGTSLDPGETVLASQYSSGWYAYPLGGVTYYFMNNANVVTNTNTNTAIKSYTITLHAPEELSLYSSISDIAKPTLEKLGDINGGAGTPYVLRQIDSKWSSIVYFGKTYYVKNADITSAMKAGSTSIATTTVGGTYAITIGRANAGGNSIPVYGDSKLTNNIGTLEVGRQVNGTKMYVDGANTLSSQNLVYAIPYGNRTGYIDAAYVSGVKEGDEVAEAKKAAQDAANAGTSGSTGSTATPVGASAFYTVNEGTLTYQTASTSSQSSTLASTATLQLTKLNADWYSVSSWAVPRFIRATDIETGSNSGGSASVGETFSLTFLDQVSMYGSMDATRAAVGFISVGDKYTLTKISDSWYEISVNGEKRYVQVKDVRLPDGTQQTGTQGSGTTDSTGAIITAQVMISPTSGTVNLRREASTSSTILARIPKGTVVQNNKAAVMDKNNQRWYSVTYNGISGYVIGTFVTAVGTVESTSDTFVPNPGSDIGRILTVNVSSVNIRSNAGTGYSIVGTMGKGDTVIPLDFKTGSDGLTWYKFMYSSSTVGYIRADFLAGSASMTGISGNVAIRAGDTNLRSGAGDNFSLIMKLPRDTIVTIVGSGTDSGNVTWYNVTHENIKGYVRSDLVRPLTNAEAQALQKSVVGAYTQLQPGDKGPAVTALQQQLILIGYLTNSIADGSYGPATTTAVKSFQTKNGLQATGIATPQTQQMIFNAKASSSGGIQTLDWFAYGFSLINKNKVFQIYDINTGTTWTARYINGSNHADVIPNSKADALKLTAANITGSYVRRPVVCTIAGIKYAGSMYAVGHGSSNYCDYFSGVMCIHFTGSKTHGTDKVDPDHQAAIDVAAHSSY